MVKRSGFSFVHRYVVPLAIGFGLATAIWMATAHTDQTLVGGASWPIAGTKVRAVEAADTFRIKAWNSWPQAEQANSASPIVSVAGPENFQFKAVIKFRRRNNPEAEVTATWIGTMDNDAGANGATSAGTIALPFGRAANKGKTDATANCTANNKTIDQNTLANPTVVRTTANHLLTTGDLVVITGSNSTPSINGTWYATVTDATHFTVPVNVSIAGTTGSLFQSRTLTVGTGGFFTADDVTKNITSSVGGTLCSQDTISNRCQGPLFPVTAGNTVGYQGTIIGFTNGTTVTVKPSFTVCPGGAATIKVEPVLLADEDGLELGSGWITGVDINYWQSATLKVGQALFEAEINRGSSSMHQGISLISKCYLEPSGHLSWPDGRCQGGGGGLAGPGWSRIFPVTQPGAAANWTVTVPAKVHVKNITCRAQLVTDATAANRIVSFTFDDGTAANAAWTSVAPAAQTATQTTIYYIGQGVTPRNFAPAAGALRQYIEIPNGLELSGGGRISQVTANITGTDQWSGISCGWQQYNEE